MFKMFPFNPSREKDKNKLHHDQCYSYRSKKQSAEVEAASALQDSFEWIQLTHLV